MTDSRTMPTVVVARTPAPGLEVEFEAWLRRLAAAAREWPGHAHSDIQPPNPVHPGEWVIIYQFAEPTALTGWLGSDTRREILAEGRGLIVGAEREQVVALARPPEPATGVASFRVLAGSEQRYAEFHQRLEARLAAFPGFVRSELFPPVDGVQDETVVVFAFDTREHLDAWLSSGERRTLLGEIAPFLEGARTVNVVGGFAGWFGTADAAQVRRWRQASIVLLALFPTSVVLTVLREWLIPDVHWVLGIAIGNTLGVAMLTWVLMPHLTRRFERWLRG